MSCLLPSQKFNIVRKYIRFYLLFIFLPLGVWAQPPAGYYSTALGLNGQQLRVALEQIIRPHTVLTYTPGLWNAYYRTDVRPDGKLWDIYSDVPGGAPQYEFTMGTDQCSGSSPNHEGGCYNREHTWPKSKFNSAEPMYTDLFIVYPTDYYVNSKRADLPYGEVGSPVQYTFTNGSKVGPNTYPGAPTGSCFEPIDSFKGDIARNYFYVATCYLADSSHFNNWEMANKVEFTPWAIQMLLEWDHMDPVSQKEINRNDSVYAIQGNRNPFIDYPQFADCIWGTGDCSSLTVVNVRGNAGHAYVYPNPADDHIILATDIDTRNAAYRIMDITGRYLNGGAITQKQQIINVHDLWPGLYIIDVLDENDRVQTIKFIKQ